MKLVLQFGPCLLQILMNALLKRLTTATKSVATMMEALSANVGLGMSWMMMECHATGKVRGLAATAIITMAGRLIYAGVVEAV